MNAASYVALATQAARAGAAALSGLEVAVLSAEGKDLKTNADMEAEARIVQVLQRETDFPILTEEAGMLGAREADWMWVVDPLDGTINFAHGIPMACVSIALMQRGTPVVGVLLDLASGLVYRASEGSAAWRGECELRVSGASDPAQAVVATGFPSQRNFSEDSLLGFVRGIQAFKKMRLFGSAALSLAYVANGWVDAYIEAGIRLWDVAAGMVLVARAGGVVAWLPSEQDPTLGTMKAAATPALLAHLSVTQHP